MPEEVPSSSLSRLWLVNSKPSTSTGPVSDATSNPEQTLLLTRQLEIILLLLTFWYRKGLKTRPLLHMQALIFESIHLQKWWICVIESYINAIFHIRDYTLREILTMQVFSKFKDIYGGISKNAYDEVAHDLTLPCLLLLCLFLCDREQQCCQLFQAILVFELHRASIIAVQYLLVAVNLFDPV